MHLETRHNKIRWMKWWHAKKSFPTILTYNFSKLLCKSEFSLCIDLNDKLFVHLWFACPVEQDGLSIFLSLSPFNSTRYEKNQDRIYGTAPSVFMGFLSALICQSGSLFSVFYHFQPNLKARQVPKTHLSNTKDVSEL